MQLLSQVFSIKMAYGQLILSVIRLAALGPTFAL